MMRVKLGLHEYKRSVKSGYNLSRKKWCLLSIWALVPLVLFIQTGLFFGVFTPATLLWILSITWLLFGAVGLGAIAFRPAFV